MTALNLRHSKQFILLGLLAAVFLYLFPTQA